MNNNASCRIVSYDVRKDIMIDSCCSAADEEYEFGGELRNNLLSSQKFSYPKFEIRRDTGKNPENGVTEGVFELPSCVVEKNCTTTSG